MRSSLALVVLAVLASAATNACITSRKTSCGERVCPPSRVCSASHGACVLVSQKTACEGQKEAAPCSFAGRSGVCDHGVCFEGVCGNGVREQGEVCDDGNRQSGDGCSGDCLSDETCGNGVVDVVKGEACDCGAAGATVPSVCTQANSDEPGALCRADCKLHCGDGVINAAEDCEGADLAGKQCTDVGFYAGTLRCGPRCRFDTSGCKERCGDGIVNGAEDCDGDPPLDASCLDFGFDRGTTSCSALCKPAATGCRHIGVEGASAAPIGVNAVWQAPTGEVFAVGRDDVMPMRSYIFDGTRWRAVSTGINRALNAVWGVDAKTVYAAGDLGVILRWDGTRWAQVAQSNDRIIYGLWGTSAKDIYAVGGSITKGSLILHFDGTGWREAKLPAPSLPQLNSVWGSASDDVYAVGNFGAAFHFDGTSWKALSVPTTRSMQAVFGSSKDDVHIVGNLGLTLRRSASGSFTQLPDAPASQLLAGWSNGEGWIYAGANLGISQSGVLLYHGGHWSQLIDATTSMPMRSLSGRTVDEVYGAAGLLVARLHDSAWVDAKTPQRIETFAVAGSSPTDMYLSAGHDIFHFDGTGWTKAYTHGAGVIVAMRATASGQVFAADTVGSVATYDGSSWSSTSVASQGFADLWAVSSNEVYAVTGAGGEAYRYDGATWSPLVLPVGADALLGGVWASGAGDIVIVGTGVLLHHDGTSFKQPVAGSPLLLRVWGSGADDIFAVGRGGLILHYDGKAWSPMASGVDASFSAVFGTAPDDVFAGGLLGEIVHYDGQRWTQVRAPSRTGGTLQGWWSIFSTAGQTYFASPQGAVAKLIRLRPW